MPAGNDSTVRKPGSRLRELGLGLPKPPSPLGAYVEASQVGPLLFLSGTLPSLIASWRSPDASARTFRPRRAARLPSWLKLIYWHDAEKGSQLAAWEQPEIFTDETPAAFRSLR